MSSLILILQKSKAGAKPNRNKREDESGCREKTGIILQPQPIVIEDTEWALDDNRLQSLVFPFRHEQSLVIHSLFPGVQSGN